MSDMSKIMGLLEAGIKAEGLRQKAIANNIANLNTPGYRRVDIKFEEQLIKAMNSNGDVDLDEIKPVFYQPKKTPIKSNGNDVNLNTEVGEMVKNSLRHKAFIRLLSKKYKQLEMAMSVK